MRYSTHIPAPPLSEFIDCFWHCEDYNAPHAKERLLPTGSMELVISLRDKIPLYEDGGDHENQSYSHCIASGVYSESMVINTASLAAMIGVHFRPGSIVPFFQLPANELHNLPVPLDNLWGSKAHDLHHRLLEAKTVQARFAILEKSLLACVARSEAPHPAVAFALDQFHRIPHTQTIADVSEQIGLSQKRFIRTFREEVGLTPKLYCRIRRFQEVLRQINKGQPIAWVDIAASCGYFDQAHFIHDFQAFSGLNPSTYLSLHRGEWMNHVPLPD